MSNKEEKPAEQNQSSWKDFIYNPRNGEFIGRTASSWALILLFYLVFYGFLAGMFTLTMWVMLQTLDDNIPKYRDRVSNPGLVIKSESLDIFFNRSDPSSYNKYVQHLETFMQQYNDTVQEKNTACTPGMYFEQDNQEDPKKVCQFKRSILRQCSGMEEKTFGYSEGTPCVIVKMNRIIGLKPRGSPFINCTAKVCMLTSLGSTLCFCDFLTPIKRKRLGRVPAIPHKEGTLEMHYFPDEGKFDLMYFPYYGKKAHENYVQPLVAVKLLLKKPDYNKELTVECKIEGSDLRNDDDRDKFLGRVTFRVKVTE
ncbi:AT1B3 ATPase, partial [Amia calva]|nr:AT1B3 ATPase [Amia calva]